MNHPVGPTDPEPLYDVDDSRPLRELQRVVGRPCAACGGRCSAREAVGSIALGFKNAPRCLPCLGHGLGRDAAGLRVQLADYIHRRECYRRAWAEAGRLDGVEPALAVPPDLPAADPVATPAPADEAVWDAGPLACGDLVLALRVRLAAVPPGGVVRVRATDPAAPEDVPAWCRLTGHSLVSASPPDYRIRRKGA